MDDEYLIITPQEQFSALNDNLINLQLDIILLLSLSLYSVQGRSAQLWLY